MRPVRARAPIAAILVAACAPAFAGPLFGDDDLQRNGAVSRHLWTPGFATGEVNGMRVTAGLALGLRGGVQSNLGRSATPALTFHLDGGKSLSLLPGDNHGVMLVLQTRPSAR